MWFWAHAPNGRTQLYFVYKPFLINLVVQSIYSHVFPLLWFSQHCWPRWVTRIKSARLTYLSGRPVPVLIEDIRLTRCGQAGNPRVWHQPVFYIRINTNFFKHDSRAGCLLCPRGGQPACLTGLLVHLFHIKDCTINDSFRNWISS